ncbi:disease resistance protein RUN1-like isoform X2 [Cryptomeria japonica]|uniref:disease resistance protein RUN1-like isoform X2 n=1 Tax=Cryptomeria japonica TaxID=3369 RepID=UPI0027DA783F|nr:disease resistance protein RUN1-like isoform X2 [Cryptomeria japonica]
MEISVQHQSQPPAIKILCDLNEEFHQYQPPINRIPFDVNNKFNVFLSFRGKDVRKTFVDHLYESLSGAGLRVFLDSEELEKGKDIDSSLQTAIETSDVFIPIFSQHYAESPWCLKEAAQMLRSNGFIIPLFYDVEPCDVRYPQREGGPFAEAFRKHYSHLDRQDETTIEEWKNALYQISSLSGWTRAEEFGYEGRLVKRVVKDVLNTLKITPLDVPVHLVGLETHMCDLLNRLDLSSSHNTVRVGVSGIGGVGKTTLAKAVYNGIYARFNAYFFAQKNNTLVDLQRAILRRLVNYHGEVSSVAEGKALMENLLRGVCALVILDDVNDRSHLDAVNGDWFGPGSRIIITSRNRHILNLAKVDSVLEMSGLGEGEALQLFCWHAFSRAFAENPYKQLSTRIAKACRGHPLALQVIGAHLFDKKQRDDIQCWEEALHNIGENQEISEVLRISYDGLSHVEKEIFQDIAYCFAGERENDAVMFWEVLHPNRVQTALKNLSLKMLIGINVSDSQAFLSMHDLLREMGRGIQEQVDNNRRLWLPMGAHRNLSRDRAEGVNMLVYTGENGREPVSVHRMHSLRYLVVQNTIVGNIGNLAPNLLWIKIRNCEFVSDTYSLLTLRNRFQLDSNWSQVRILSVDQCASITRIPNTLDSLVNLRRLYLRDCIALTTLPNTLGNLSQLEKLYLGGCTSLTSLPHTVGNLRQLKYLGLEGCTGLRSLPSTVGNLRQLEALDLSGCIGLRSLPSTVGDLAHLKVLYLRRCTGLSNLPNTIGDLAQLWRLSIFGCSALQSLRYPLAKLQNLRSFTLSGSGDIESFHDAVVKSAQKGRHRKLGSEEV